MVGEVLSGNQTSMEPAEKPVDLVGVASAYFLKAVVACPTSNEAQGAKIALLARRGGYDVFGLRDALLGDPPALQKILRAANIMHANSGNSKTPEQISILRLRSIIGADYKVASLYADFSDAQLEYITGPVYEEGVRLQNPEGIVAERVSYMNPAQRSTL